VAPLKGSDYSGLRGSRVPSFAVLLKSSRTAVRLGSLSRSRGDGSWDLLCQHAAQTGDYRNPDFASLAPSPTIRKILSLSEGNDGRGLAAVC